jgi:hypothetical protein
MEKTTTIGRNMILDHPDKPLVVLVRVCTPDYTRTHKITGAEVCRICSKPLLYADAFKAFVSKTEMMGLTTPEYEQVKRNYTHNYTHNYMEEMVVSVGAAKGNKFSKRNNIRFHLLHTACMPSAKYVLNRDVSAHEMFAFTKEIREYFVPKLYKTETAHE